MYLYLLYFCIVSFMYIYSNLVIDIVEGKEAEGVWEHGVEENIWT